MISVSKGNKQKYAHQLHIMNSGSGGMGFLWTSHSFFLEVPLQGFLSASFFPHYPILLHPWSTSIVHPQEPVSTWASYFSSCYWLYNIKWKVFSVCFKMLNLWSPSDTLIRCGCLLNSAHTGTRRHTPFQFWKCVPKNSRKHSHWLSVFLYKYGKHSCL